MNKTWNPLNKSELLQPLRRKKETMYVLNDLFANEIQFLQIDKIMAVIALCSQHTFQLATKEKDAVKMKEYFSSLRTNNEHKFNFVRAFNGYNGKLLEIAKHSKIIPNLWLGVQIENQEQADSQIPLLLEIPAAVRFVLCESILCAIDLKNLYHRGFTDTTIDCLNGKNGVFKPLQGKCNKIDWVIVGGESGKNARPMHPDWVRSIKNQCKEANVPFYFKGWGEWLPVEKVGEYWHVNSGATTYTKAYLAENHIFDDNNYAAKVGKKSSGCLLDGYEYKELPN